MAKFLNYKYLIINYLNSISNFWPGNCNTSGESNCKTMKKQLLILSAVLILFSACEVVIVEEPVPVIFEPDPRDLFIGTYGVDEYSETFDVHSNYAIRIYKSVDYPNSVIIDNFYGLGLDIIADIDGYHLYIPDQDIDGYHVSGDGYIEGRRLSMSYAVDDLYAHRPVLDICTAVAWR